MKDAVAEWEDTLLRFGEQGEKTGWTFLPVPAAKAEQLFPGRRKAFPVRGLLDQVPVEGLQLLPVGQGDFILPLNATLRRALKKEAGQRLRVRLQRDPEPYHFNEELITCLQDDGKAWQVFQGFTASHQRYFSKWIDQARTMPTRARRIAAVLDAMHRGLDYAGMIRAQKTERNG